MILESFDKHRVFSDLIFNLKKLFKLYGYDIRVYGNVDPCIVIDNKKCLSCYVSNSALHIMNGYKQGDELKSRSDRTLFSIPIPKNINKLDLEGFELGKWIKTTPHREMFYIQKDAEPFTYGESFSSKHVPTYFKGIFNNAPEFSPNTDDCKLFFREDECIKVINELETLYEINNLTVI